MSIQFQIHCQFYVYLDLNLDIKEGGTASNTFLSMVNGSFEGEFGLIHSFTEGNDDANKKRTSKNTDPSCVVAGVRLELTTFGL